jgi:ADP-ribosylglycohydrolase
MISNKQLLDDFYDKGRINLENPKNLRVPEPIPDDISWDKVEGMLLGLAIGDSLGNTLDRQTFQVKQEMYGWIDDYLPNRRFKNEARGFPSDDTQMAFWLLEHLNDNGRLNPEALADIYASRQIFVTGKCIHDFQKKCKDGPWYLASSESAGNGAIMRIAPIVVPYIKNPSVEMWASTILVSSMTHNDRASTAACMALVRVLWNIFRMGDTLLNDPQKPFSEWVLKTWCSTMKTFEGTQTDYCSRRVRKYPHVGHCWEYTFKQVSKALKDTLSVEDACDRWGSSAYLAETIPSILYILCTHHDSYEDGVLQSVNCTVDSDTISAVVGAVLGALHGKQNIPERWINNLSGRTNKTNDGEVQKLIAQAKTIWWEC